MIFIEWYDWRHYIVNEMGFDLRALAVLTIKHTFNPILKTEKRFSNKNYF